MNHSDFLTALGWAVVNSIWQFALLWGAYQIFTSLRPRAQAATKSALASGMLLTGFGWFLFTFFSYAGNADAIAEAIPYLYGPAGWNHWIIDALPLASLIYLLLLAVPVVRFIRNYRYVQLIRSQALQKADVQWRLFVQKLSAQMGIQKKVELWVSHLVTSPVTIGYLRPIILLPVAAVNHLSAEQVEAVLLHELAHIRRFDYMLNLVVRFIQTILYFNPFVKAFVRIVEAEREKSCDEMVIQFQYDAQRYAAALLTLERSGGTIPQPFALAAAGTRQHQLLGRVENILGVRRNKGLTGMRLASIMLALSCMSIMHLLLQWKKPATAGNADNYLSYMTSPHLLYSGGASATEPSELKTNKQSAPLMAMEPGVKTPVAKQVTSAPTPAPNPKVAEINTVADEIQGNLVQFVTQRENILSAEQEAEVKKALQASTRVINEVQWKLAEKSIADALSSSEKELIRDRIRYEAAKVDMDKLEARLRQAYHEINWPQLNADLEAAVSEIRFDSLQTAYTLALSNLATLEHELARSTTKSVPDTDISLKNIARKKSVVAAQLQKLKAVRDRKIIRL